MSVRPRLSVLFFIGILLAGSTALGYYYLYVYSPPLKAADRFDVPAKLFRLDRDGRYGNFFGGALATVGSFTRGLACAASKKNRG